MTHFDWIILFYYTVESIWVKSLLKTKKKCVDASYLFERFLKYFLSAQNRVNHLVKKNFTCYYSNIVFGTIMNKYVMYNSCKNFRFNSTTFGKFSPFINKKREFLGIYLFIWCSTQTDSMNEPTSLTVMRRNLSSPSHINP